ncbi:MAG: DUF3267 domain-containing protein [Anaerolineales bacterium]
MRATQTVPSGFHLSDSLVFGKALTVRLLVFGFLLLIPGILFFSFSTLILRGEKELSIKFVHPIAALIIVLCTVVIHELVHGAFFWYFSRACPQFGLTALYAYATLPGWYFPRTQYLIICLAPFVLISLSVLAALALVPKHWMDPLFLAGLANFLGSVGDLYVAFWILRKPKDIWVQDLPNGMEVYSRN